MLALCCVLVLFMQRSVVERIASGVVVPVAAGGDVNHAAAAQAVAEQQVREAEAARRQAILDNDTAALERLIAGSFVGTLDDGRTTTKADELGVNRPTDRKVESWVSTDVVVRVYGDTAVVTGRAAVKDRLRDEGVRDFAFRFTHIWSRINGQWQLVGRHISGRSVPRSRAAAAGQMPPPDLRQRMDQMRFALCPSEHTIRKTRVT